MSSQTILALSLFVHLIATVVWIGGLVILSVLVVPEARRVLAEAPAFYDLLTRLRRRFTPLSNFSLIVLVMTGMFQMSADPNYDGMLQFTNVWSRVMLFKHITIVGMAACGLILQYGITPALERVSLLVAHGKGNAESQSRLRRQEVRLTWANVLLGILVLGFSAWATAL